MGLVVRLVEIGCDGGERYEDIMTIDRSSGILDIADVGLRLSEGKQLLAGVQQGLVAFQVKEHCVKRPVCVDCGCICRVKDYRDHALATLYGSVAVRIPRFRCTSCGKINSGVDWPSHCRSTPALDELQAQLSALVTYRVSASLLAHMFPIESGKSYGTLRLHTLKMGTALGSATVIRPAAAASINVTLDSTFLRSCEEGQRHLEARVGNVETDTGGRQVFGAITKTDTDIVGLIQDNLEAVGRTKDTVLTAFTDGCDGLRNILADAGITGKPFLDWFHISMRLQHLTKVAAGLPTDNPQQETAKADIVEAAERFRWRLWHGQADKAPDSISRIEAAMPPFENDAAGKAAAACVGKLRNALQALGRYLTSQSDWLINYAERQRDGLPVGTSITEGTANFLVNRRMNKSQQMRWSRQGANLLLQVRCAVYNGTIGSGFGQKFYPANDDLASITDAA
jgi:hypothetical protein